MRWLLARRVIYSTKRLRSEVEEVCGISILDYGYCSKKVTHTCIEILVLFLLSVWKKLSS